MCKVWILGILDFGLGILDGHLVTKFWMLHKKRRLCTPNRVGGFHIHWQDTSEMVQNQILYIRMLMLRSRMNLAQWVKVNYIYIHIIDHRM